jgi:uncharacterized membrane protein
MADEGSARRTGVYERGQEEFLRVLALNDGVYAIAMTLLVVGIGVPTLEQAGSEREMLEKLDDLSPELFSFLLSFAVIGRYWFAHHEIVARIRAFDSGLIAINLVYLAFIAFLPFPTNVLGNYPENAISVALYALTVAAVSGLEVALFARAYRKGLLWRELPADVYRWSRSLALSPVFFFLASIPVAFVNPRVAILVWFLAIPAQPLLLNRRKPPQADELLR